MSLLSLSTDQFSLSFIRGLVASVNPCGFVLLPTYLMYFLGVQSDEGSQRASMRRALLVSSSVSAGFLSVFLVVGFISHHFSRWVEQNAKYATAVIAVGLIGLGIAMLFGYRLPISTPKLDAGGRDRTAGSMFVYGIAYAVASISCTIGLFIPTVFGTAQRGGIADGVANALAYGAGMALIVIALTVSLAAAKTGLVGFLRSKMQYVEMTAAVLVIVSGLYLLVYFWVVDINYDTNPITSRVEYWQTRATVWLNDNWQLAGFMLAAIVAAAIVVAFGRRDRGDGSTGPPPAGPGPRGEAAEAERPATSAAVPSGTVAGDA